jgi:hypothetical protein
MIPWALRPPCRRSLEAPERPLTVPWRALEGPPGEPLGDTEETGSHRMEVPAETSSWPWKSPDPPDLQGLAAISDNLANLLFLQSFSNSPGWS